MTANPTEIRRRFDEEGYVVLPGFFSDEIVQGTRQPLTSLVDQQATKLITEGKISDPLTNEPFESRLYRLYENHLDSAPRLFRRELHLAELFNVFFHPRLLDAVETLLGPEILLYPNYTVRPKLPEWEGTLVLWHQDGGYTEESSAIKVEGQTVDQLRMINVWSPIVPARVANGCMQFIPGTHKLGVVPHSRKKYYLEIADEYLQPRLSQAVNMELDPGDVILFHNLLFHQGLPNQTKQIRWSMDWRYQDATQSTLRVQKGHLARSRSNPSQVVRNAADWAARSFT